MSTTQTAAWSSLGSHGLTRETAPKAWQELHALAVEAHETTRDYCPLTFEEWNALVSAVASGLPITLAHEHRGVPTEGTTERTTRSYVVDSIGTLSPRVYNNLRARTWGFSIPLALGELVGVTVPEATYEYERDEALECEGHPAGPFDEPMGQTTYCDGSCRS